MRAELWNNIQRVLPNEIQREQLKPGDHIYTWRDANTKHHGIYISDEKVIHFTEGAWSDSTCPKCGNQSSFHAVVYSCIDCFLTGGYLHLFEYSLNAALFLAKLLNGTCTLASSDTPEVVQNRASFLLSNGSADYYSYINNSEDFAIYCKTGLLVIDNIDFSRRFLQTAFFLAITAAVYQQQLIPDTVFCGILGRFFGLHCISRFASDIRVRPNVIKVDQALNLPQIDDILASGPDWAFQRKVQSIVDKFLVLLILAFALRLWSDPVQVWSDTLEVVWSLPYITSFYWAVLQKRLLSNKIQKEQLKPGDHIYTWKRAYTYAHHGIYVANGKVIHLNRGEASISGGGQPTQYHVESCCINCFLAGGELYLYKYGVNLAFFLAKIRGGTCKRASADPTEAVLQRAEDGEFGAYNLLNSNCEDFAVYCKTGSLPEEGFHSSNGQIAAIAAILLAIYYLILIINPTSYFKDVVATVYFIYLIFRYGADHGTRVPPQELRAAIQTRIRNYLFMISFCIYLVFLLLKMLVMIRTID